MTKIGETNYLAITSGQDGAMGSDLVHGNRLAVPSKSPPRAGKTKPAKPGTTKAEIILKKLAAPKGASIPMLVEATGWQAHSVRGFLSGTVKKKLGHTVDSEVGKDGTRRYRIARMPVDG